MGFSLDEQMRCLFAAFVCGLILGAIYDLFRFLRCTIFSSSVSVFVLDVLYMLVFTIFTLFLSMAYSFGEIRYFSVLAEVAGILCVRFTIGRISVKCFSFLYFKITAFFKKILIKSKKSLKRVLQGIPVLLYNKVKKKPADTLLQDN